MFKRFLWPGLSIWYKDLANTTLTAILQHKQHPFNSPLFGTIWMSRYQKGKTNLDLLDLLEQQMVSGSGISWVICKSAPCPRQITMPAPHHSVFYRLDALPTAQPTVSKQWMHQGGTIISSIFSATYVRKTHTHTHIHNHTTVLRLFGLDFVRDNPGAPVPEETFTHL